MTNEFVEPHFDNSQEVKNEQEKFDLADGSNKPDSQSDESSPKDGTTIAEIPLESRYLIRRLTESGGNTNNNPDPSFGVNHFSFDGPQSASGSMPHTFQYPYALLPLVANLKSIQKDLHVLNSSLSKFGYSMGSSWKSLHDSIVTPSGMVDKSTLEFLKSEYQCNQSLYSQIKLIRKEAEKRYNSTQLLITFLNPPTIEYFNQKYSLHFKKLERKIFDFSELEDEESNSIKGEGSSSKCCVCYENPVTVQIVRKCSSLEQLPESRKCEDHFCEHRPSFCLDCIVHHYWQETNHENKRYSTCPVCKAQFCLRDLVLLVTEEEDKFLTQLQEKDLEEQEEDSVQENIVSIQDPPNSNTVPKVVFYKASRVHDQNPYTRK